MKSAVRLLTQAMEYEVPEQDLGIDLSRMPAIPNSGFVMLGVRRAANAARDDGASATRREDF